MNSKLFEGSSCGLTKVVLRQLRFKLSTYRVQDYSVAGKISMKAENMESVGVITNQGNERRQICWNPRI